MSKPPGVYTSVTAAAPSAEGNAPTGTWFVSGMTQQGPVGVAVPIQSMSDYTAYLGSRVSYGNLYDALTEYFHDGGVQAYVSRVVGPSALPATISIDDRDATPAATLTITAVGAGTWGDNLTVVIANGTVTTAYTITVQNNGKTVAFSTNLFSPADAVTWAKSLDSWVVQVSIANANSTSPAPTNLPKTGTYALTGGSDTTAGVTETQWTAALTAFTANKGPGQVSAPGHTTTAGYTALVTHASKYNRVALLDVATSPSATNLVTQASGLKSTAGIDPSYAGLFGPWIVIPGIAGSTPGTSSPVPSRVVAPSALAAALMAANDAVATNTANTPAAGRNGQSSYAIGVTQVYSTTDLAKLNQAGVNAIKVPTGSGAVTLYGYQSLSNTPAWTMLNNVRFRMQMAYDFDIIGEGFVFKQIDGRGQLVGLFNGDLAGKCQQYWTLGALYGTSPSNAFRVNTGPQVNSPSSLQSGYLKALVEVVMAPFADFVQIEVVKYLLTQGLPA